MPRGAEWTLKEGVASCPGARRRARSATPQPPQRTDADGGCPRYIDWELIGEAMISALRQRGFAQKLAVTSLRIRGKEDPMIELGTEIRWQMRRFEVPIERIRLSEELAMTRPLLRRTSART